MVFAPGAGESAISSAPALTNSQSGDSFGLVRDGGN